jgi:CubicO group peptidase (beta-lactamase class C family)
MRNLKKQISPLILILFFLLLNITPIHAQVDPLHNLDPYVQQAMKEWQVPGVAIGIVKDDSLIFARGYGVKELGKEAKVDEHTIFAVASNTKAFTAALLGMLVDEGKINWDDYVVNYMKDFQMYDPYITREINIKDLLTHRSGLPTFGGDHLWIGSEQSREDIIARIRYLEPTAPFRTKFQYQNLMFLVAGQLIPKITGQNWDDVIKERIFKPLGMVESMTTMAELKEKENVAAPHEIVGGKVAPVEYDYTDNTAPAGAIKSNVLDMAQWMRFNLSSGVYKGKQILSQKVMREMHTVQFPLPISSFSEEKLGTRFAGYGLGWSIYDYKGRKIISHGGGLSGMISYQVLVPEEKLGVIVVTNFAPNSLPRVLTYRILDAFFGEPEQDWNVIYLEQKKKEDEKKQKAEQELQEKRAQKTKPSLKLEAYTGKYFDDLSGEAEIKLEKGKLVFNYNPRHIGDLEHWHYNTFRVIWRNPIFDMAPKSFLNFYLDEKGKVEKLKVTFYDPIYFKKLPETE